MFRHILRLIRLFRGDRSGMDKSLLTAGKGSGTGVYAEIFVSLILNFFLFNLLICIFFCFFSYFFYTFFYNHSIYARSFYLIKLIFNFFLFIYFIYIPYFFFTRDIYPHPHTRPTTSTHYPRHLATLINIWLIWVRQQERRYNMDQNQEQVLF